MKNKLPHILAVARGHQPADLVLKGALLLNVFSGELQSGDVAIADGTIAGVGGYEGKRTIDLTSRILLPGFIDSHVHIESSLLTPAEFCRAVLPFGTTAVIADPHEIANVLGKRGIRFMLKATEGLPLTFYFMLPSCVPASSFETSGARLAARDLLPFRKHPRVRGLAEVMDVPGVLAARHQVLEKLRAFAGMRIDGHAPGLNGSDLGAYRAAGITSDHEASTAAEAAEKAGLGMTVLVRESSAAKNLEALLPAITAANSRFFCFATDDRDAEDLMRGGINRMIRKAVRLGLDPVTAVRMATINPAMHYRLERKGAIAPGYDADIVAIDNFKNMSVEHVFSCGHLAARKGKTVVPVPAAHAGLDLTDTVHVAGFSPGHLRLPDGTGHARVIQLVPGRIETRAAALPVIVQDGQVANSRERNIAKLVVVERHRGTGRTGLGLVKGFGLKAGAFASTVAHDSHNIIAVGVADHDIVAAVRGVARMRGGMIVVRGDRVLARLPLPVAGLMSLRSARDVAQSHVLLERALKKLGVAVASPFAVLSFLALPVIPALKLTDRGLVDATRPAFVSLFTGYNRIRR